MFSRENVKITDKRICSLLTETNDIRHSHTACTAAHIGKPLPENSSLRFIVLQTQSDMNYCEILSQKNSEEKEKRNKKKISDGKSLSFLYQSDILHRHLWENMVST